MGKKHNAAKNTIEKDKLYDLDKAVESIKSAAFANFDETVEVAIKLGVDPRQSDQMVRGVSSLPAGTGKDVKVAVICKEDKFDEAKAAGADMVGNDDIIESIKAGKIEFDVCIATPDMMGVIGQVARVLGPKGLMPNPKLGTVTADVATAVKNSKSGQVEFRVEKAGIIHAGVGKVSFKAEDLVKNIKTLTNAIIKAKPSGAKGTYLKAMYLTSTMGTSVKLNIASFTE